jgi:hypothetical protein
MPYLITEDGSMTDVTPKGKEFTLEEMQAFVGGLVQLVPSIRFTAKPHPILTVKHETLRSAWCNEEGLLKGLSENRLASLLAGQPLVGPVVLFTSRDPKDEWNLDGGIDGETEIGEKYGEEILGVKVMSFGEEDDHEAFRQSSLDDLRRVFRVEEN